MKLGKLYRYDYGYLPNIDTFLDIPTHGKHYKFKKKWNIDEIMMIVGNGNVSFHALTERNEIYYETT